MTEHEISHPAVLWEHTMYALIEARPFASTDDLIARANAIADAYQAKFFVSAEVVKFEVV